MLILQGTTINLSWMCSKNNFNLLQQQEFDENATQKIVNDSFTSSHLSLQLYSADTLHAAAEKFGKTKNS